MDVMIKNGDIVTDGTGRPVYIDGIEEILQRVRLTLSTRKGAFIYNKDFGCETLFLTPDERCLKNIEAQLREALINMPHIRVDLISAEALEEGLMVSFSLEYKGQKVTTEVVVK